MIFIYIILLFFLNSVLPVIYLKEEFNSLLFCCTLIKFEGTWAERWVHSELKPETERGIFSLESPKKVVNKEKAKGLKTMNDSKFYQISLDIGKTVTNFNKTLILSYTVITEHEHRCGGTYLKVCIKLNYDVKIECSFYLKGWIKKILVKILHLLLCLDLMFVEDLKIKCNLSYKEMGKF
jgi:hypothetical protein